MGLGRRIKEIWLGGGDPLGKAAADGEEEGEGGSPCVDGEGDGKGKGKGGQGRGAREEDVRAVVEGLGRLLAIKDGGVTGR